MLDPYTKYPTPVLYSPTLKQRIIKWLSNEGKDMCFLGLWILIHLLIFTIGNLYYQFSEIFTEARKSLGITFVLARSSALVLHIDTALILFPMCRNFISYLRKTSLNLVIPFDKSTEFHKLIGYTIVFFTLIHTFAHYFNFYWISVASKGGFKKWMFLSFITGPGWTGHIMLFSLLLILITATERVKRYKFEIFWYTHHLFSVYFFGFTIHGAYCLVKQDNVPYCKDRADFWKYFILSSIMYLTERILREVRGFQKTEISKVVSHPGNVIEIQIKKDVTTQAGQWIFICFPCISLQQWHPFTLTSAPEENYLSIHVRVVGDFTKQLAKVLNCDDNQTQINNILPKVMIDGPFGSASEDVFDYEVSVLVGAGIGVTPFASILKSIWYRVNYPVKKTRLNKVYFIWICREKGAFEWFQDLLKAIEEEDLQNFIEIHTYLTGKLKADEMANVILNDEEGRQDAVTGLKSPTHYGRPNLDQLFSGLCHIHPGTDIGVFFCGPKVLSKQLNGYCNKYNQPVQGGTKFYFGKENF